jgi:hypothetical protein
MSYYVIKTVYNGETGRVTARWADLCTVRLPREIGLGIDEAHRAALVALLNKAQRHGIFAEGHGDNGKSERYFVAVGLLEAGPGPVRLIEQEHGQPRGTRIIGDVYDKTSPAKDK